MHRAACGRRGRRSASGVFISSSSSAAAAAVHDARTRICHWLWECCERQSASKRVLSYNDEGGWPWAPRLVWRWGPPARKNPPCPVGDVDVDVAKLTLFELVVSRPTHCHNRRSTLVVACCSTPSSWHNVFLQFGGIYVSCADASHRSPRAVSAQRPPNACIGVFTPTCFHVTTRVLHGFGLDIFSHKFAKPTIRTAVERRDVPNAVSQRWQGERVTLPCGTWGTFHSNVSNSFQSCESPTFDRGPHQIEPCPRWCLCR
jgi:hypothetical protein